jgi:hypothetical protein
LLKEFWSCMVSPIKLRGLSITWVRHTVLTLKDLEGSPEVSAVLDKGSDDAASGTGGSDPAGSGHANAGVSPASEGGSADNPMNGDMVALRAAVLGLDPDVDENWTALGKPAMGALEYLGGGVTRKMVVAAAGDFDRDKAHELKSL